MDHVRKIITEEVAKVFETQDPEDNWSVDELRSQLKFARHYLNILDKEAFEARQIVHQIQDKIESDRSSGNCEQLIEDILQITFQMKM